MGLAGGVGLFAGIGLIAGGVGLFAAGGHVEDAAIGAVSVLVLWR